MPLARHLAATLASFAAALALFLTHRALTFSLLSFGSTLDGAASARAFFVGALSDLWVAYLFALVTLGVCSIIGIAAQLLGSLIVTDRPASSHRPFVAERTAQVACLLLLAGAVAAHHPYVEFFRAPIAPFHLTYLADRDFLSANATSGIGWAAIATFLAPLWTLGVFLRVDPWRSSSAKRLGIWLGVLSLVGLAAHNRNIRWRETWFVPAGLQSNVAEHLYRRLKAARLPPPLTASQLAEVGALSVPVPTDDSGMPRVAIALRDEVRGAVARGARPLLVVVLMESLRPSETGFFTPAKPSLTPRLDELARTGIAFTRAYSVGSVTRAGQEAVLCGYLSGRDTSLMRGMATTKATCLTDRLTDGRSPAFGTFWLHGGEPGFDRQVDFWRRHGVETFMTGADFPPSAARTDWGVGDQTFFSTAAARLAALRRDGSAAAHFGIVLSISNHIPWVIPTDAPPDFRPPAGEAHPSYASTAYADAALGTFVSELKAGGAWDDSMLLVLSDHGTLLPPRAELYDESVRAPELSAHIDFVVAGGLAGRALAAAGAPGLVVDHVVSQADVAPLLAWLLDDTKSLTFMGDHPFAAARRVPVLADLGDDLYVPATKRLLTRRELLDLDPASLAPEDRRALLYYRAFLRASGGLSVTK